MIHGAGFNVCIPQKEIAIAAQSEDEDSSDEEVRIEREGSSRQQSSDAALTTNSCSAHQLPLPQLTTTTSTTTISPSSSLSITSFTDLLSSHDVTFNLSNPDSLITTYPVSFSSSFSTSSSLSQDPCPQDPSHAGFCTAGDKHGYIFANDTLTVFETGYGGGLKGVLDRSQPNVTKLLAKFVDPDEPKPVPPTIVTVVNPNGLEVREQAWQGNKD